MPCSALGNGYPAAGRQQQTVMKLTEKYIETSREFYVRLFQIAVPVILQSIITTGVNLVDNIMLGQLTETALGASTQANQFITLFTFATMGISMGTRRIVTGVFRILAMISDRMPTARVAAKSPMALSPYQSSANR